MTTYNYGLATSEYIAAGVAVLASGGRRGGSGIGYGGAMPTI